MTVILIFKNSINYPLFYVVIFIFFYSREIPVGIFSPSVTLRPQNSGIKSTVIRSGKPSPATGHRDAATSVDCQLFGRSPAAGSAASFILVKNPFEEIHLKIVQIGESEQKY